MSPNTILSSLSLNTLNNLWLTFIIFYQLYNIFTSDSWPYLLILFTHTHLYIIQGLIQLYNFTTYSGIIY